MAHRRIVTVSLLTLSLGLAAQACTKGSSDTGPSVDKGVSLESVGLSTAAMDTTVDACQDFYQYACGNWLKNTEIPADKTRWARGFSEIAKRNEAELKRMFAELAKGDSKVGKLYSSCMDEAAIEKRGTSDIKAWWDELGALAKLDGSHLAKLHAAGIAAFFSFDVDQDFKDPTLVIAHVGQDGLGLPDRDYYLKDDDRSKKLREQYVAHLAAMFKLMKHAEPAVAAKMVMTVETELARLHKTRLEMRNIGGLYNPIGKAGLKKMVKSIDWDTFFGGLGYRDGINNISISTPKLFAALDTTITEHSVAHWRVYLQWKLLDTAAMSLPKPFVDEAFKMSAAFSGQKEIQPRWKRCVASTSTALRDLVSQEFIKTMFPGSSKEAAEMMVKGISEAFGRNLTGYTWMDDKTRARAEQKRTMMAHLIGYPSKWKTYNFTIDPAAYLSTLLAARRAHTHEELAKVDKPVDRNEWAMGSSVVNAYYHPLKNHMVFPAGILQKPIYDVKSGVAVNLGGMGMIVGHELTHGFDDQGSQFSGSGKMENWWEAGVAAKFNAKKQCLIDQYNRYEVLPGVNVNGKLTLGENIADLGGVKLAYGAYKKLREGKEPIKAGGFTEDQQFFLAVGQAWCSKTREKRARMLVKLDPHSPPKYRVIGSVSSMPEFAEAFSCKPATPMNPTDRCTVW